MKSQRINRIEKLYKELSDKYGIPGGQWKLWCKRPKTVVEKEEVIIGALLTQRTNWNNVERVIDNLKKAGRCSLLEIYNLGKKNVKGLEDLIKPSGFYRQKAGYLFGLTKFIVESYKSIEKMEQESLDELRKELLRVKGLGRETVDDILLYALGKPVFVIDEYTRRLVKRHELAKTFSYEFLQQLFEENLPRDYCLYQDFHALIIIEEKTPPKQRLLF